MQIYADGAVIKLDQCDDVQVALDLLCDHCKHKLSTHGSVYLDEISTFLNSQCTLCDCSRFKKDKENE